MEHTTPQEATTARVPVIGIFTTTPQAATTARVPVMRIFITTPQAATTARVPVMRIFTTTPQGTITLALLIRPAPIFPADRRLIKPVLTQSIWAPTQWRWPTEM